MLVAAHGVHWCDALMAEAGRVSWNRHAYKFACKLMIMCVAVVVGGDNLGVVATVLLQCPARQSVRLPAICAHWRMVLVRTACTSTAD